MTALVSLPPWLRTTRAVNAGAVGIAALAGAVLIVGPALPGHVVAPWWISAQPHIQAIGGADPCAIAARRYRDDLNYSPPPGCLKTAWFQGNDGHWRIPLPVIGTASVNRRVRLAMLHHRPVRLRHRRMSHRLRRHSSQPCVSLGRPAPISFLKETTSDVPPGSVRRTLNKQFARSTVRTVQFQRPVARCRARRGDEAHGWSKAAFRGGHRAQVARPDRTASAADRLQRHRRGDT